MKAPAKEAIVALATALKAGEHASHPLSFRPQLTEAKSSPRQDSGQDSVTQVCKEAQSMTLQNSSVPLAEASFMAPSVTMALKSIIAKAHNPQDSASMLSPIQSLKASSSDEHASVCNARGSLNVFFSFFPAFALASFARRESTKRKKLVIWVIAFMVPCLYVLVAWERIYEKLTSRCMVRQSRGSEPNAEMC
mmetsp:Transcript_26890/g.45822  ORF Transcript_26890/g.45822 Transcript_26890/m.45822 type:complete len:193 (+) Transcript_26890:112-690(+)